MKNVILYGTILILLGVCCYLAHKSESKDNQIKVLEIRRTTTTN